MEYDLGIDLGTTYSCAARSRDGRIELVQLGHTTPLIPSVVSLRDDGVFVVGEAAERRAVTDPSRTVRDFKRRMGDEAPYVIGGTPYGAEVLAAELLRTIVAQVEDAEGAPARRIALDAPGELRAVQARETARSGHPGRCRGAPARAGTGGGRALVRPAGEDHRRRPRARLRPRRRHVRRGGRTARVVGVAGSRRHTRRPRAARRHRLRCRDPQPRGPGPRRSRPLGRHRQPRDTCAALARLRDECKSAKEALSSDTETQIPVLLPDLHETVRLTRAELEQMLRPRLEDTFPVVERVVTSAGIAMADIAVILTVGGSSRIPLVAQMLREQTQRPVAVDPNPKASVALGAAAVAGRDAASRRRSDDSRRRRERRDGKGRRSGRSHIGCRGACPVETAANAALGRRGRDCARGHRRRRGSSVRAGWRIRNDQEARGVHTGSRRRRERSTRRRPRRACR